MAYYLRLFISFLFFANVHCKEIVINTENGIVKGYFEKTRDNQMYYTFRGIRYAESPTGENRFQAPVPKKPWFGIFDATTEGPVCPQDGREASTLSEDCLLLNVHTKSLIGNQSVMVFIHGGSLIHGDAGTSPEYLLEKADVVFVAIQYRLGPLGFLSTGDSVAPGNYGFKDQTLALKWVQENIHRFGGNRNSVTILGQSAGAMSVTAHLVSPLSAGLFHRAIAHSGSTVSHIAVNNRIYTNGTAQKLGCPLDNSRALIDCVRSKSFEEVIAASNQLDYKEKLAVMRWNYEIEDPGSKEAFLTEHPNKLLSEGRFNRVPVMMGFTSDELYILAHNVLKDENSLKEFNEKFDEIAPYAFLYDRDTNHSREVSASLRKFYLNDTQISLDNVKGLEKLFTDSVIAHGVHLFTNLARRYIDVYYWYFKYLGIYTHSEYDDSGKPYGVGHTDDLTYVFTMMENSRMIEKSDPEDIIVERMTGWWTHFAQFGTPNNQEDKWTSEVEWMPCDENNLLTLSIDKECKLTTEQFHDRFTLWDELFPVGD